MKLIVLSTSGKSEDEPKLVTQFFEQGLNTFHLRKAHLSTEALSNYIKQIPEVFHHRIVIHTHHNLALKYNLKGIHLGKYHRQNKIRTAIKIRILQLKMQDMVVSTSFHKLLSIYENEGKYSYVFLSPVFNSLTGNYQSGYTEHALREANKRTKYKVIARGGITFDVIEKISALGFAGMALYSGIWNKKDPVAEFIKFLDEMKRLGIENE